MENSVIASSAIVILVVLTIYFEYTGKIELRELKAVLKQKISD